MNKADEALAEVRRWLCDSLSDGDAGKVCGMLSVVSRRIVEIEAENAKLRELVHIAGTYCVNGLCGKDDGCPLYLGKPYCALPELASELGLADELGMGC